MVGFLVCCTHVKRSRRPSPVPLVGDELSGGLERAVVSEGRFVHAAVVVAWGTIYCLETAKNTTALTRCRIAKVSSGWSVTGQ